MKHWILGLDEAGADRLLVEWLESQPDPDETVKMALRAFAFPQLNSVPPRVQRALAALRSAVADVEAAVGLTAEAEAAAAAEEGDGALADADKPPAGLSDDVVDSKIGKLLDFDDDRDSDLGAGLGDDVG